jgi:uncharacterized membrane protein
VPGWPVHWSRGLPFAGRKQHERAAGILRFHPHTGFRFPGLPAQRVLDHVDITPRVEAALKATPLAVMVGLVVPAAMHGGMVELTALAVTALAMKITKSDLLSAVIGVAVVAVGRSLKLAG